MIPPLALIVRIREAGKNKFNLWLPLFLLWPFAGIFFVLLLPFIALFFAWRFRLGAPGKFWIGTRESWNFACAMRGLHIEVEDRESKVLVEFS